MSVPLTQALGADQMDEETCPKCRALFAAESAWENRTIRGWLVWGIWQNLDTRVRCPKCRYVFDAQAFRYFGVVTPRAMRLGIFYAVVALLTVLVVFGLMQDAFRNGG
jgi:hypothetical protein